MTSAEKLHAKLLKRLAELEQANLPIRVWHVKCVYPSTSVTLRIKAISGEDAISKARKAKIGKGAVDYVVVSVE
jgi:hypothetical protein